MDRTVLEQQARFQAELRRSHAIRNAQLTAWWRQVLKRVAGSA